MVRWTDINEPGRNERDALEYLKANLPDAEPYRAWGPFQFPSDEKFPEVDGLIIGPRAVFLIELKNYHGDLYGTTARWQHGRHEEANPYMKLDSKAKWLRGQLARSATFKRLGNKYVPRIEGLVFLSGDDFTCHLPQDARKGIVGFDKELMPAGIMQGGGMAGVIEEIRRFQGGSPINAELSEAIATAVGEIGIQPSGKYRQVGSAVLDAKLSEDEQTSEYSAHHEHRPDTTFRVTFHHAVKSHDSSGGAKAERAAEREYDLLSHRETHHDGLPRASDLDPYHPHGAAVVFSADHSAARLDEFLASHADSLSEQERLDLFRQLAVAVNYAHSRRMFHRALRPSVIYVSRHSDGHWQPVIFGWHTGLRAGIEDGDPASTPGTITLVGKAAERGYAAPESELRPPPDAQSLDVFSLGALGYLILTGVAPPADQADALAAAGGFLDPLAVKPDFDEDLRLVITEATSSQATKRLNSADEILDMIEMATQPGSGGAARASAPSTPRTVAEAEREETSAKPPEPINPNHLRKGSTAGRFTIEQRIGEGSTAQTFRATRDDHAQGVLKIASAPEQNERLDAEGAALATFQTGDHRTNTVVELIEGPFDLGGRSTLFLGEADRGTLRDIIRGDEARTLQAVREIGEQLLEALEQLERSGVKHRDIKPENIGLKSVAGGEQAVLLDFSLSGADDSELGLGTPGYIDPFLGTDRPYDAAADRYAAAVVLHELLTGDAPMWGDGRDSPNSSNSPLTLSDDKLPPAIAGPLSEFFNDAMERDIAQRFDSAKRMRRAWEDAFDYVAPASPAEPAKPAPEKTAIVAGASFASPQLVIDAVGQRLRVSFRKRRNRVDAADVQSVESALAAVPKDQMIFDSLRKCWQVIPTPESAAVLDQLRSGDERDVRPAAERIITHQLSDGKAAEPSEHGDIPDPAEPQQEALNLGHFSLFPRAKRESFVGTTLTDVPNVPAERLIYEVEGPDGILLTVSDAFFENGERHIQVLDASGTDQRFERLTRGCRMGVTASDDVVDFELRQARMKEDDHSTAHNATIEQLDHGAGIDMQTTLRSLGAGRFMTKGEMTGAEGARKNTLCTVAPLDAELVPVAAYVMTRVSPVYLRMPA